MDTGEAMKTASYNKDDPGFLDDLRKSKNPLWRAATWLSEMGYSVIVKPTFERPGANQMSEYADNGDIEIVQTVEVKHRPEIHFTCQEDFPYPTIIVDVAHHWDRAHPKPYAYMIFNADMSVCCVVKGNTRPLWNRKTRFDANKNRDRDFYECPIGFCKFVKF